MHINGEWVGLGLGDVSPSVSALKTFLVNKFSYALPLRTSLILGGVAAQTYDQTMVDVVTKMQAAYGDNSKVNPGLTVSGIMNKSWDIRSGYIAPPKVTLLTWQGTGVDMWDTGWPQPAAVASQLAAKYPKWVTWQPVGNYPASITNPWMGTSVQMGVDEAVRICTGSSGPGPFYTTGPIIPFGYSQGAICASHFWRDHILNPNGALHHRLNDVKAACTYGNPCRAVGIAHGNDAAGWGPSPQKDGAATGGISGPDNLTADQTPPWFYDYVWLGTDQGQTELYTVNPDNATGKVGTMVYDIVQDPTFGDVVGIAAALLTPVAMVEEIWNGITFVVKGPNADHFDYDITPALNYLSGVIENYATNYINSGGAVK